MITIAVMVLMKANSVIHNTKHVHLRNSLVKISNAFAHNIDAMVKMIVAIILMKLVVQRKITVHALLANSNVQTDNVLTINLFVIRYLIVVMNLTNRHIVTLTNVLKLKFINVVINVLTL